jgi:hypothetical protein
VLSGLFRHYLSEKLGGDELNSHVWTLVYRGKHSQRIRFSNADMFSGDTMCDYNNPYPLSNLLELNVGDTMKLEYDMGSTTFMTCKIVGLKPATAAAKEQTYPIVVSKGHAVVAGEGFLSSAEKEASLVARERIESTEVREWSYYKEKYVPVTHPPWSPSEVEAMHFLLYSGIKFTKAWNEYVQYCILTRTKGTSSGKWYQLKKEAASIDQYHSTTRWLYNGQRYTLPQCLTHALRILVGIRSRQLGVAGALAGAEGGVKLVKKRPSMDARCMMNMRGGGGGEGDDFDEEGDEDDEDDEDDDDW